MTDFALAQGLVLFTTDDGALHGHDAATGAVRYVRTLAASLSRVLAADDALFVGSRGGVIFKVSTMTGRAIWEHHGALGRISKLQRWHDQLVSGSDDGTLWRWDMKHPVLRYTELPVALAVRATPRGFVMASEQALMTVDLDGGTTIIPFPKPLDWVGRIDMPKVGVVSIERSVGNQWLANGAWHEAAQTGRASLSTDGALVALFDAEGVLTVQDAQTAEVRSRLPAENIIDEVLIDDLLIGATRTGELLAWPRAGAGDLECRIAAHSGAFSLSRGVAPGTFQSSGITDGRVRLWSGCSPVAEVTGLTQEPLDIQFDLARRIAYVLTQRGELRIFDTAKQVSLAELPLAAAPGAGTIRIDDGTALLQGPEANLFLQRLTPAVAEVPDWRPSLEVKGDRVTARLHQQ